MIHLRGWRNPAKRKHHAKDFQIPVIHSYARGLTKEAPMNVNLANLPIQPVLAILIGILILLVPRFLNYFVAVYLIVVGILGLMHR